MFRAGGKQEGGWWCGIVGEGGWVSDRGIVVAMSKWDVRGISGVIEDNDQIAVDHCLLSNALSENWCKLTHL